MVNEPLRVNSVLPVSAARVVKNPSPLTAMSSAEPVCSIGPSEKFCAIVSSVAPIPWISRGLDSAEAPTTSAKSVRLFLKPLVSVLAMLWAMTPRSVCAFLRPLSEI